jgi:ABC-type polysaccharide/polyol phosphate export permease
MKRLVADVRDMVREQIEYRELLYRMVQRDLLIRYKQAVMGIGWALFMPVVNTILFSVVFTRVARIDVGMPYPLFAFCGLLAWNFFVSAQKFAVISLSSNTTLVTKVYFPRETLPFTSVLVSAVDYAVASLLLVGLMIWYRIPVHTTVLLVPLVFAVQFLFTTACALLFAMANLFYRDVKYLSEVLLTVWMFGTSVLYPVSLAGGKTAAVMRWNPMTGIIDAYRSVLIIGEVPGPMFVYSAVVSAFLFSVAWLSFHRSEFLFAENI